MFTFGIEVEFFSTTANRHDVADNMNRALSDLGINVAAEHYNHAVRSNWKIVHDGSLNGCRGTGMELVSPVLQLDESGFQEVRDVLDALNREENSAQVNIYCGVHLHLKWNGMNADWIKNVIRRYAQFESEIDRMFPNSRRANSNQYCRSFHTNGGRKLSNILSDSRVELEDLGVACTRYNKINLCPLNSYGTIEFRQHAGSTDSEKILNWVSFASGFVTASNPESVSESVDMTDEEISQYKGKQKRIFGEIIELYGKYGWEVKHKSKGNWTFRNADGEVVRTVYYKDIREWFAFGVLTKGDLLKKTATLVFTQEFLDMFKSDIGDLEVADSEWKGIKADTVEFFKNRIEELERN